MFDFVSTAAFKAKYKEQQLLGQGGFGTVFAGYRKEDNLPVRLIYLYLSKYLYLNIHTQRIHDCLSVQYKLTKCLCFCPVGGHQTHQ